MRTPERFLWFFHYFLKVQLYNVNQTPGKIFVVKSLFLNKSRERSLLVSAILKLDIHKLNENPGKIFVVTALLKNHGVREIFEVFEE